jgi:hypothetical protein
MSDVTLNQLAELPATVTSHAAQIANLESRLTAHEATINAMAEKWDALATAVKPPAVTRPLMAIPKV